MMKRKVSLLAMVMLCTVACAQQSAIVIRHIGVSPKYIYPVVFSTQAVDTAFAKEYVKFYNGTSRYVKPLMIENSLINESEFQSICEFIETKAKEVESCNELGCFQISCIKDDKLIWTRNTMPVSDSNNFLLDLRDYILGFDFVHETDIVSLVDGLSAELNKEYYYRPAE